MRSNATGSALAALALAATAFTAAACSSATPGPGAQDLSNDKHYSLTQDVQNSSGVPLTVSSVTADNGGTVTPGYPTSIGGNASGAFVATNVGNGVQIKVTLQGADGQTVVVDSDVPKVDGNWSRATITGNGAGLSAGPINITGGDEPTATFLLQPCTGASTCSTSATTNYPPLAAPSTSPTPS